MAEEHTYHTIRAVRVLNGSHLITQSASVWSGPCSEHHVASAELLTLQRPDDMPAFETTFKAASQPAPVTALALSHRLSRIAERRQNLLAPNKTRNRPTENRGNGPPRASVRRRPPCDAKDATLPGPNYRGGGTAASVKHSPFSERKNYIRTF